jgi:hypothetical protein
MRKPNFPGVPPASQFSQSKVGLRSKVTGWVQAFSDQPFTITRRMQPGRFRFGAAPLEIVRTHRWIREANFGSRKAVMQI